MKVLDDKASSVAGGTSGADSNGKIEQVVTKRSKMEMDPRLLSMTALLQLERDVRRMQNRDELKFLICNETHRLVPYDQAVLCSFGGLTAVKIEAVSSLSQVDQESPYSIWLQKVIKSIIATEAGREVTELDSQSIPEDCRSQWPSWCKGKVLWCPLITPGGVLVGGLWLLRNDAPVDTESVRDSTVETWKQSDRTLLERLAEVYAYSWQTLDSSKRLSQVLKDQLSGKVKWLFLAVFIAGFIPVKQSVLAPAQVAPRHPQVISAPMEGVVKDIFVEPNSPVKAGQKLFELDDTNVRNRLESARKALAVAEANYLSASQKAFGDSRSKNQVAVLKATMLEKQADVNYAADLLNQIAIKAGADGVVLFSDANDWLGKPVAVGQKVMTVADIHDTWLEVWMPVDDAIALELGAKLTLFLNVDPLQPIEATLKQTSYEAELSPQDILGYRIKASFDKSQDLPRLGLKGTAKIYGHSVSLAYYVFRRPLVELRQLLGL